MDSTRPVRIEYERVARAISELGCLAQMIPDDDGDRLQFATTHVNHRWSGNVFWLAERRGHWLIGTYGVRAYLLR
jgi:hypothetical protein